MAVGVAEEIVPGCNLWVHELTIDAVDWAVHGGGSASGLWQVSGAGAHHLSAGNTESDSENWDQASHGLSGRSLNARRSLR